MSRGRFQLAVLASVLMCVLLGSCARCGEPERPAPIATISTISGPDVKRDYAERVHAWEPAKVGAQLRLGDGAQTGGDTTAELTFITGATLTLSEGTTVRLLPDVVGDDTAFDIETGRAKLRAGERGLSLRTHVGRATIAPESEVVLTRSGQTLGFDVALGTVSFRDQAETSLAAGDSVRIGIGTAVLDLQRARVAKEPEPVIEPVAPPFIISLVRGQLRVDEEGRTRALPRGDHALPAGTAMRLAPGGELTITHGAERALLRGAGELAVGDDAALLEVKRGTLTIETDDVDITARIPVGQLVVHRAKDGSSARLTLRSNDGSLLVTRGRVGATIDDATEELTEGEGRSFSFGSGAPQRGPAHHNFLVGAGQSFVVHTPTAPVAVGFDFSKKCPREGQLELAGGRQQTRARDTGNLSFGVGIRTYTLRCIGASGLPGRIVARGSVHVLIDTGTRKLPPRAPTSFVEADGRSYSIYYQNQLPAVVVRWPRPPAQPRYQLFVDQQPIELTEPRHEFRSGELTDGTHTLSFQAQGRRSRTTTVVVRFDNAAPKASLTAPENGGFVAGDLVVVEGVALPNWKVALLGGDVTQGAGERFSGQVQTTKEQPDIAVRLSHPRLGTHYYLRRASGSP